MDSFTTADAPVTRSQRRLRFLALLSLLSALTAVFVLTAGTDDDYATQANRQVHHRIAQLGTAIVSAIGTDPAPGTRWGGGVSAGLAAWSESSVYVERTNSIHPSRPSSFGPHLLTDSLPGLLFPVTAVTGATSYGCHDPKHPHLKPTANDTLPTSVWIALVQRGQCPFSQKVRYAQANGAIGVIFGDQSYAEGGVGGLGGLLTPWSPDETPDITIPSAFVSRASYLSLLKTYADAQLSDAGVEEGQDQEDMLVLGHESSARGPVGLVVVLAQEEMFVWPLFDLLLLLLFLPSLLTLLTFFTHRVRLMRRQKAERAPKDAVAKLPVFTWGDAEKDADAVVVQDEEQHVGLAREPVDGPTESTALLAPPTIATRVSYVKNFFLRSSASQNSNLAAKRAVKFQNVECAICLSDFERGERVMQLPCGHAFHEDEALAWLLKSKRLCPVCRASITDEVTPPSEPDAPSSAPVQPIAVAIPSHLLESTPVASSSSVTLDPVLRS